MKTHTALAMKELNFDSLLSTSWNTFKKKWTLFLGFLVLTIIIQGALAALQKSTENSSGDPSVLFGIANWIISVLLSMGWVNIYLKVVRGEKVDYQDLYNKYPRFIAYVLGTILSAIIVIFGFILLIVPGVIWSIKYMFVPYLLIDKKIGVFEALKVSAKMTQGEKWRLFWYGLGFAGINILGFLALFVGMLVSVSVTSVATALLYNAYLERAHAIKK